MNRDEVKQRADIVHVIGSYVKLKKQGQEHVACCPFHSEKSPSFKVNQTKQKFKCFGCGEGGDVFDFVEKFKGVGFKEAAEIVASLSGVAFDPSSAIDFKAKGKPEAPPADPQLIPPAGSKPDFHHRDFGMPVATWEYRNAAGQVTGYVGRYNGPDRKEIVPFTFRSKGWTKKGFDKPRHIYRLHELATRTDYKSVMVVEGEKAADAAQLLFPTIQVVTWQGGAGAILLTDWLTLEGKRVILCPDNDREKKYNSTHPKAGEVKPYHEQDSPKAMHQLAAVLLEMGCKVFWLDAPEGSPDKWDWADFTGTTDQAVEYLKGNTKPYAPPPQEEPEPQPKKRKSRDEGLGPAPASPPPPPDIQPAPESDFLQAKFRPLGHNKAENGQSEFYFFSAKAGQVLTFKASSFTKTSILQLDNLTYFHHAFRSSKLDMEIISQALMNECYERGVYNSTNTRGIGAWMDEGRVIVHTGDHLIVGDKPTQLHEIRSKYLYEANEPFHFTLTDPLSNQEAVKLHEMAAMMNWDRPINAYLFAGFCVLAPVCGALKWRPHIWITGGRGAGKSTALNMMKTVVGKMAIHVQGVTSEAGIRQTLGQNARPVLFDEADIDGRADTDRVQSIIALMRSSSTHDGGDIIKGGQSGSATAYRIRSCFAFASITPQVANAADSSRVTILSMYSPRGKAAKEGLERWKKLQSMMAEVLTEAYSERLISRTVRMLPTILRNADTFARAAAAVLGEQRAGDQLGTLLAGAFALHSSKEIPYDDAVKWLEERQRMWGFVAEGSAVRDEVALLNHIMEQLVMVETASGYKYERTVGELIELAYKGGDMDAILTQRDADNRLRRIGIKVDRDKRLLVISNTHTPIKRMLENTAWSKRHSDLLARLDDAKPVESTKFGPGTQTRAVAIPLGLIIEVPGEQLEIGRDPDDLSGLGADVAPF